MLDYSFSCFLLQTVFSECLIFNLSSCIGYVYVYMYIWLKVLASFSPASPLLCQLINMSFLQELFSAVAFGIEASNQEVRGKRQRTSPGGGSTMRQTPGGGTEQKEKDLSSTQLAEVTELIQGGMNGLA